MFSLLKEIDSMFKRKNKRIQCLVYWKRNAKIIDEWKRKNKRIECEMLREIQWVKEKEKR